MRTLVFVKSRKLSEIVTMHCVELLQESSTPELAGKVISYRAGYLPHRRRELEKKIFNKEVLGIAATNALELGGFIRPLGDVVYLLPPLCINDEQLEKCYYVIQESLDSLS